MTITRASTPGAYTSLEAFAFYRANDGDEILIRPDGYLA
ncbi:MAG: hypothetical protein QOH84_1707 [Kribbellaceae bacterium]|nr:hypothetical protein [Kribbellaceae bacterium]